MPGGGMPGGIPRNPGGMPGGMPGGKPPRPMPGGGMPGGGPPRPPGGWLCVGPDEICTTHVTTPIATKTWHGG